MHQPLTTPMIPNFKEYHSQSLGRKPQLRSSRRIIKDDKLRLEEDVTKDGLPDAIIALETTETASTLRSRCVVQVTTRDDRRVAFDLKGEIGKGGGAVENVSTVGLAVGGSRDLTVVGGDDVVGEEKERSSGVGNGGDALSDGGSGADGVPAGCKPPETLRVVDGGVGNVTGVLARINVAKVVTTRLALLQVGGEERRVEAGLGVGEESLLLVGGDGVDGAKGQAQEAIALVLSEFRADGFGQFDGLAGDGCTADIDNVRVYIATSWAAISVANVPSLASVNRRGWGVGWVVDVMTGLLVCGQLRRENPSITY